METGLFLIRDKETFRKKIHTCFPSDYYRTLLEAAEAEGREGPITSPLTPPFNWHAALAWVLTGQERYALSARQSILHFTAQLRVRELYREGQIDHWVGSLPVARVLVYYTWVRDSGAFAEADKRYIEQSFSDYLYLNVYQSTRLKSTFDGNNQTAALVVSCIIMGYILGQLIDSRASSQVVLRYGFERLGPLLGSMPRTGYTGEGSTYMAVVAAPTLALLDASLQYMTDTGLAGIRFSPNGSCVDDLLEMNYRCFTPSGYLLPWDHYDYVPALGSAALAWYAHYKRPELLGLIRSSNVFAYDHEIMWGGDDQILTAVFWPAVTEESHRFGHWIHPEVGAGLWGGSETGLYIFQMWDRCEGVNPVRQQVNPNSLVFEFSGVPFLMDGMPTDVCTRFADENTAFSNLDGLAYNFGYGTLAGHNVIIIDDDEFYRPELPAEGNGTAGTIDGTYPSVRADVTEFYRDIAGVKRIERTSILLSSCSVVIVDDLQFDSTHDYEARFFLRAKALPVTLEDGAKAYMSEINDVCACLIPDPQCVLEHEFIEGYPRVFEASSTRIAVKGRGVRCRLVHVLCGIPAGAGCDPKIERTDAYLRIDDNAGTHTLNLGRIPQAGDRLQGAEDIDVVGSTTGQVELRENLLCPDLRTPRPGEAGESAHDRLYSSAVLDSDALPGLLRDALQSDSWEDRLAAVDCIAYAGIRSMAGETRQLLDDEQSLSHENIYDRYVWLREGVSGKICDRCEWRLKTALVRAAGELEIQEVTGLLEQMLSHPDHSAVHRACRETLEKITAGN